MTTLALQYDERRQASADKAPTLGSTSLDQMSESNERLARVEQRLESHGDTLIRLERHMETMSDAHCEMSKAMGEIPSLLRKNDSIQQDLNGQIARIFALEKGMEHCQKINQHLLDKIEPRVNKSYFIANVAAWLVGTVIVSAAGAISIGIVSGDLTQVGSKPETHISAIAPGARNEMVL